MNHTRLFRNSKKTKRLPSCKCTSRTDSNSASSRCGFQPSMGSRRSRYSNVARSKETEREKFLESIPGISTATSAEDTREIRPSSTSVTRPVVETNTLADSLFHLFNCDTASSDDERMFLILAKRCGLDEATHWALQLGWNIQRPLQVLRAMKVQ